MRKLTLEADRLEVESFDTAGANGKPGTVRGNDFVETDLCTGYPDCISKPQCKTPYNTCYGTCGCTKPCETHPLPCR